MEEKDKNKKKPDQPESAETPGKKEETASGRTLDKYKTQLAEKLGAFMEHAKDSSGTLIRTTAEVLDKHYDWFVKWMGSDTLLKDVEAYLGRPLDYEKDLKHISLPGGLIFDQVLQNRLLKNLDDRKAQVYYGLVVDTYKKGFEKHGLGKAWTSFLGSRSPQLAVTVDQFVSKDTSIQKRQKGQIPRTAYTFDALVKAFQEFCASDELKKKKLTGKQIQTLVSDASISNADFVEALVRDGHFSSLDTKEIKQLLQGKITFDKNNTSLSKKDLDAKVADAKDVWKFQDTFLKLHITEGHDFALDESYEQEQLMNHLMKHTGGKRSVLDKYPQKQFLREKMPLSWIQPQYASAPEWKIKETLAPGEGKKWRAEKVKQLAELQQQLTQETDAETRKVIQGSIADLEQATRDDGVVVEKGPIIAYQEFIDEYLARITTKVTTVSEKKYIAQLQMHNTQLSALQGEVTPDGVVGNIDAMKTIMQFGIEDHIKHAMDKLPHVLEGIAKTYGKDLRSPAYMQFWLDIYDPSKLEVSLPSLDGESSKKIRFKRKGIRPTVSSFHAFMAEEATHEEHNLFDIILEVDTDTSTFEELGSLLAAAEGKQDALVPYTVPGPLGRLTRLQHHTSYTLSDKNTGASITRPGEGTSYTEFVCMPVAKAMPSLVFVPAKIYLEYMDRSDDTWETDLLTKHAKALVLLSPEESQDYIFRRTQGVQLDEHSTSLVNMLYLADTDEGKPLADPTKGISSFLEHIDTKNAPNEDAGAKIVHMNQRDNDTLEEMFRHVGFSDTVPSDSAYTIKNKGKVISRVDEGKIMFDASYLEQQFRFRFVPEEKPRILARPWKFTPIEDDGLGARGFREMFGHYKKEGDQWVLDSAAAQQATTIRNEAYKNSEGQFFAQFLRAKIDHEKMHRVLEFYDVREVPLFEGKLSLDQELLCEIAEWWVAPHQKSDLSASKVTEIGDILTLRDKDAAHGKIVSLFQGESPYRVIALDKNKGRVEIQRKDPPRSTYVLDIADVEEHIWQTLIAQATGTKAETLNKLHAHYQGKFFDVVRKLDTKLLDDYISDKSVGTDAFQRFLAASTDGAEGTETNEQKEKVLPTHGKVERSDGITDRDKRDPDKIYVHSDNDERKGRSLEDRGLQTWNSLNELGGLPNSFPIGTSYDYENQYDDNHLDENKVKIDKDFDDLRKLIASGKTVVIPYNAHNKQWEIGRQLADGSPKTYDYIQQKFYDLEKTSSPVVGSVPSLSDSSPSATDDERNMAGLENVEKVDWKSVWGEIQGDQDLDINKEPSVFFRTGESKLQGFGAVWIQGIVRKKGEGYAIELVGATEGDLGAYGAQGKMIDIPSPEALQKLYRKVRQGMLKYKTITDKEDFYNYIMGDLGNNSYGSVDDGRLKWQKQYMSWEGGKIMKTVDVGTEKKTAPWSYIGKSMDRGAWMGHPEDSVLEFYRIQQHSDHVTVEAVTGDYTFKQDMSRSAFLLFMTEKKMDPYTEAEYKEQKEETHEQLRGTTRSFRDNFMSLNTVIAAFKKFPEAFKYRIDQQQKFESAILYEKLATGLLPGINALYLSDIKADATSELDSSITQVIEGYKERLSRKEGDSVGVHGNRAVERIENEIFKNPRNTLAYKHRAAGYLAYMVENEGNLYSRNLSKYAGKAEWVKVLLGEEQRQEFFKWKQVKQNELKNQGREDEELFHDFVMMELLFIQEHCDTEEVRKIFGSRFPKKVEAAMEYIGSQERIDKIRKGIDAKGSIYAVVTEAESKIEKLQSAKAFHTLYSLCERCEEPHHEHAMYKVMVEMMVSGVAAYTFSNTLKGKMKQLGRTFGIPTLLMAKDIHHPRRVTRLIDNIARNHHIPTLTSYIQNEPGMSGWDAADTSYENFSNGDKHKKVVAAVKERWPKYGYTIMDSLNNMDSAMLSNSMEKADNQEAKEIEDAQNYYRKKMFDGERNTDTIVNADAFKAVLNPLFQRGILNYQKPAFKKLLQQNGGGFNGQLDNEARQMRKHLTNRVGDYGQDINGLKYGGDDALYGEKLKILFRKFAEYFKEDFKDVDRERIIKAFKAGKITESDDPKESVYAVFNQRMFLTNLRDGVAQRGVTSFLDVFADQKQYFLDHPELANEFDL